MAAVLRSAARRLAGELPAVEMVPHRLPLHSEVSVWNPSSSRGLPCAPAPSLRKAKAAMEIPSRPPFIPHLTTSTSSGRAASPPLDKTKAVVKSSLLPPFIPSRTMSSLSASQPPDKAKAVIERALLPQFLPRRTMSSSSGRATSEPADKFCFYVRAGRMTAIEEARSGMGMMMVYNKSEELCLNWFWTFMRGLKKNEFELAKEIEYMDMQLKYDKAWEKVHELPWFRKLNELQDHLSDKIWVILPGSLLLAGLGESSDWKLPGVPHSAPPGPGEETSSHKDLLFDKSLFDKSPVEDMF